MSEPNTPEQRRRIEHQLWSMVLLNVAFSLMVIFQWPSLSPFLDEPLHWATWSPVGRNPALFDYPYLLLWGTPLVGVMLAWLLHTGGSPRLAMLVAVFPLLFMATLIACFHGIPMLVN